jgi:polyhydroxyalkanoate synthesis repressor PhaR
VRYIAHVAEMPRNGVRAITRYENRKLYDAAAARYVTLEDVGAMVAAGQDVEVKDRKTGEDLTNLTLAQVILEGIRTQTARIPRQILAHLVRLAFGASSMGAAWTGPQEAAARARDEAERIVGRLLARGRLSLEEGMALRQDISGSVHRLVAEAQEGLESRLHGLFVRAETRSNPSLHGLKDRLDTLETYLKEPRARTPLKSGAPTRNPAKDRRTRAESAKKRS